MNGLTGRILALQHNGHVSLIDVEIGDDTFTATLLETPADRPSLKVGISVDLLFKETEVALAKGLSGSISLRNRFQVHVTGITRGDLLSEVTLDYHGWPLCSVITTRAVERLQIAVGDCIEALVKANEMMVSVPNHDL